MGIFLISIALADDLPTPERDIQIVPDPAIQDNPPTSPEPSEPAADTPAPAADTPAPAAAPAAEPVTYSLSEEERTEEATVLYMKALQAWQAGKPHTSWRLSTEALTLDPEFTPARLLAGYSAYRLKRRGEAFVTLDGIFLEPGPSPISAKKRHEIRRIQRAETLPFARDQWWLSTGSVTFVERSGDDPSVVFGYMFALQVPLVSKLSVRVDGGAPWPNTGSDLDLRGPRFGVYAVASEPLGAGRWHVDLAAGPTFWAAEGRYWLDGWAPFAGVRAAVGADVRLGTGFGLRWELGASAYPWALDEIKWYAEPLDLRIMAQAWFGKSARAQAAR